MYNGNSPVSIATSKIVRYSLGYDMTITSPKLLHSLLSMAVYKANNCAHRLRPTAGRTMRFSERSTKFVIGQQRSNHTLPVLLLTYRLEHDSRPCYTPNNMVVCNCVPITTNAWFVPEVLGQDRITATSVGLFVLILPSHENS